MHPLKNFPYIWTAWGTPFFVKNGECFWKIESKIENVFGKNRECFCKKWRTKQIWKIESKIESKFGE